MRKPDPAVEWIRVAEEDYQGALDLARRRKDPLPNAVCFHCQQCVEKYLKAIMARHGIEPPRIHSLLNLNKSCVSIDSSFLLIADLLERLDPYSVETRYPGHPLELEDAREALDAMKQARQFIRAKLGLGK
ncbi:MAG: hypothetical protein A2Z03_01085 [Chloroflexi bacterium RBG_16_56_8]|nr:MAG: hypothetical protein A2Z03_01085 [Chloroflexi bacterium RBG_16_56_8]